MSSFGFKIILYLNDFNQLEITPPTSLFNLKDIAFEKFNLTKAEFCYADSTLNKFDLINESDYFEMFNFVSENELTEIFVYLNAKDLLKKKKATRKNSRSGKPDVFDKHYEGGESDSEVNSYINAGNEKDLRNLRSNNELEEGIKYSKHGYNLKNQSRIYYIKEKKEIFKELQRERDLEKEEKKKKLAEEEDSKIDPEFGKKNKHKSKKINKV
jgi:hypothetical protein